MGHETYTHSPSRSGLILHIGGDLDAAHADNLVSAVADLDVSACDLVELDLLDVTFLDSTGLRGLLTARDWLQDRKVGFAVVAMSDPVRRVVEIAGLDEILAPNIG